MIMSGAFVGTRYSWWVDESDETRCYEPDNFLDVWLAWDHPWAEIRDNWIPTQQ